ncbi:MAG TPA: YetF domain-containing protein [Verrucomicrobiae bacterium]|nr:YetF domain-containing protein [Verrucomicrobiae bacterium]
MNILVPDIAVAEKILRSVAVYGFLLVAFRIAGKRQLGQMTAFDLIVLLIISNVLQNAAIGNDNSLGGGLLGATVIIVLNLLIAWMTFRHKRFERIVEDSPTILVKHGHVLHANLAREFMSMAELRAALRREGVATMSEVRYAILEEDGHVTVIPRRSTPA